MSKRRQIVVVDLDEPDSVASVNQNEPATLVVKKRIECACCGAEGAFRAEVWLGSPR